MEFRIVCHQYVPPGQIWVSPDIYELFKKQLSEEELDKKFLKLLGIGEKNESNKNV